MNVVVRDKATNGKPVASDRCSRDDMGKVAAIH